MKNILILLFIVLLISCKEKSTHPEKKQAQIVPAYNLSGLADDFQLEIPQLYGVTSSITTEGVYLGRKMYKGDFFFAEDEGIVFVDFQKAISISKVSKDTTFLCIPIYIQPFDREQNMAFVGYFSYANNIITQVGGISLDQGAHDILLEDEIQQLGITYATLDGRKIKKNYHATSSAIKPVFVDLIKNFIINKYLKSSLPSLDKASRVFSYGTYDIDADDKDEMLVFLSGPNLCDKSGCTLLVLDHNGNLITEIKDCQPPISILHSAKEGFNDISVSYGSKQKILKFEKNSYPISPKSTPVKNKSLGVASVLMVGNGGDTSYSF